MGGWDATGTSTGGQLAQSTHCFAWGRQGKPNTRKDPPTSTRAEPPPAEQENSPWKEGAAVISPGWAMQLSSDPEGNASKAWDGQQWDRGCCLSPGTHLGSSACESQSPVATALLGVSQESPGHGSGSACAPGASACLCCIPEPPALPTKPSGCSFWNGTEMAFGFSYTFLNVCAPPEPSKCLLGSWRPLSTFTAPQNPSAFPCTPEPSPSLPAPQGILRVSW